MKNTSDTRDFSFLRRISGLVGVTFFAVVILAQDQGGDMTRGRVKITRLSSTESSKARQSFEKAVEHYNAGRYYSALEIFRLLSGYPADKNPLVTASHLMTMKCYFQIGKYDDAKEIGREFLVEFSNSSYRDDVLECFGDVFVQEGRYRSAVESYLEARSGTDNPALSSRVDGKLKHLLRGFLTRRDVEDLLATETKLANRAILTLILADNLISAGDPDGAALTLFRMDFSSLPELFADDYNLLRQQTYHTTEGSAVVGVVLPLSGFYEARGRAFLRGLKRAVRDIEQKRSFGIALEVVDNEGDNLKTIACIEKLASNTNVLAAIGPLSPVNSAAAAAVAKAYEVPLLIPVSTQVGLGELGKSIFQMNTDLERQGRYAAQYAVLSLGLNSLAIVAPADRLGKGLVDGFLEQADRLGAEIVAVEWYSGIPVDLSKQFKSLRKIAFELGSNEPEWNTFPVEFDTVDQTFVISEKDFFPGETIKEKVMTASDSNKIVLSSIDGVYLPIHPGDINYVASQFSSYNLDTQLLGNVNWYDLDQLNNEMIRPHLDGMMIFTDFLYPNDHEAEIPFIASMGEMTSDDDFRMALYGYDILSFLSTQLGKGASRATVLERLNRAQLFRGQSKLFSFTDDSPRVNASIHILQYKNGSFQKLNEVNLDSLLTRQASSPDID